MHVRIAIWLLLLLMMTRPHKDSGVQVRRRWLVCWH